MRIILEITRPLRYQRRWRGGRVVEGAPLLREYALIAHRGFESLPLRHEPRRAVNRPLTA